MTAIMAPSRGLPTPIKAFIRPTYVCRQCQRRSLATTPFRLSGHNRWSKIKHDKGKADAVKNKQRSIFASEIATASKLFGPEPSMNPRLADLITKAKREGFAKASIEAAIARGQGRSTTGASLEPVTVEAIFPNNVGVIVECETDNKLRTLASVRLCIKEAGGTATPSAYLFEKKGRIVFEAKEGLGSMDALDAALEAGAMDVDELSAGNIVVYASPETTKTVGEAISKSLGIQIATSEIVWDPNEETKVGVQSEDMATDLAAFVDDLQEKETSLQAVAMNVAQGSLSAEIWKELQSRISA